MVSYGVLSTYPPTQCGLATFSHALSRSLNAVQDVPGAAARTSTGVVAIVDHLDARPLPEVTHQWVRGQAGGSLAAAESLNAFDLAVIQHEFGIFGGRDGADVLDVARAIRVPTILVLHTVLVNPSRHQQAILDELIDRSAAVW